MTGFFVVKEVMEMTNNEIVNNRINYYMYKNGWSIADLAKKINRSHQYTTRLVKGQAGKAHSLSTIEMFATVFGVSVIDMITPLSENIDETELKPPDGRRRKQKKI